MLEDDVGPDSNASGAAALSSAEPSRAPLLMFQVALGDPNIVSHHPGQLWEVYRPHARRPHLFCVDALVVYAGRMHRRTVYTSDARHTLPELRRSDPEAEKPTPEYRRYAQGYMFSPLFDDGIDVLQTPPPTLSMRRTPGEHANAADKRAIERAGLGDLGSDNWAAQELVPTDVLRPLLPHVLVETFEFWASGKRLIWGYPRTDVKQQREEEIAKAEKKSDDAVSKATTREWYDGVALLIELIQPRPVRRTHTPRSRSSPLFSAIVNRIAWDGMFVIVLVLVVLVLVLVLVLVVDTTRVE